MTPESDARVNIDRMLEQAGWVVQNRGSVNLYAGVGVAVQEFVLESGHGTADYLLYVNQMAAGVVEAKPEGFTLTGVEAQSAKYGGELPDDLPAHQRPLPFLYQSTGVETWFTNLMDPEPSMRRNSEL
jgi:type I restriction enzyme R subunit